MISRFPYFVVSTLLTVLTSAAPVAAQTPEQLSSAHPNGPLNIRPDNKETADLIQKANALYQKGVETIEGYEKYADEKSFNKIQPAAVGKTYAELMELTEFGETLKAMGEPAGYDYIERFLLLDKRIGKVVAAYRSDPKLDARFGDDYLRGVIAKEEPTLQKLADLPSPTKLDEIRTGYFQMRQRINQYAVWYFGRNFVDQVMLQTQQFDRHREWYRLVGQRYNEQFVEKLNATKPDLNSLIEQAQKAAEEIDQTGQATWDGAKIPPHQWLEKFTARWEQSYLAAVQSLGYEMAAVVSLTKALEDPEGWQLNSNLTVQKFYPAVEAIVTAHVNRLVTANFSDADVRAAYASYVKTLARVIALTRNFEDPDMKSPAELMATYSRLLGEFAEASPSLAAEVRAYDAATSDLLRWRARVAKQTAEKIGQPYETASYMAELVTEVDGPKILQEVTTELADKNVKATHWGLAQEQGLSQTALSESLYYCLDKGDWQEQLQQEIDALKSDLLVTAGQRPLTLTAELALVTAERGDWEEVGGQVGSLLCQAAVPTMIAADGNSWGTYPLNRFWIVPDSLVWTEAGRWVWLRCELKPHWIQHKYFCLQTSAGSAAGG